MKIDFGKPFARDTVDLFGIVFEAIVDGTRIRIRVRGDALQDIEPDRATESPESQFNANRHYFEEIAIALIERGETSDGVLVIEGRHVRE